MLHGATLSQRLCHLLLSGKAATGDEQDWAAALIKGSPCVVRLPSVGTRQADGGRQWRVCDWAHMGVAVLSKDPPGPSSCHDTGGKGLCRSADPGHPEITLAKTCGKVHLWG